MDDFETNLATALRSAVPAPPTQIDPADITGTARRVRARTLASPLVTALVVAAVAVTMFALAHTGGGRPEQAAPAPATPTVSRQPSDLVGSWKLTDLQGLDRAAHTAPDATLTFRFDPNGTISQGCGAARATVGDGTLQFVQDWVTTTPTNCPHLGVQQSRFLFGRLLTGTATWEIRDGELTVQHDGANAVFQRVGGDLTTAQRALAVRTAKTAAWASPPTGSPAPTPAASGQAGWPANVDQVSAIVTTHADAMRYVGAAGGDTTLVLVIRLVGDFSWVTTPGPPGHGPLTGNVITIVINAETGRSTDTGLERQNPPRALPNATVLYTR